MERHPVPQNIMDVEFKLFGSLTIRQFGFLAGGIVIALIIYFTGLPELIKYILVGFFVFMGIFLALVKINGQASATWVTNFVAAMFNSQSRVWKKNARVPEILAEQNKPLQKPSDNLLDEIRKDPARVKSIPLSKLATQKPENPWDKQEQERLKQIEQHFDFAMKNLPSTNVASSGKKPGGFAPVKTEVSGTGPLVQSKNQNLAGNLENQKQAETIYETNEFTATVNPMNTTQVNRPIGTSNKNKVTQFVENKKFEDNVTSKSQDFNVLRGKVMDIKDVPIPKVTLLVKDEKENLLRRIVTNTQGEFFLTNPLPNGLYYIDIVSDKHKFDRQTLKLASGTGENFIFKALN